MATQLSPQIIADAFVVQYYAILNKSSENLHKFYQEPSLLGWPGTDGVVTPVTTLTAINEKIMSSDFKNFDVEIISVNAQESIQGAVLVAVSGLLLGNDDVKKNFSQNFFLAKQEKGFFVLNDILHIFDVFESVKDNAVNDDDKTEKDIAVNNDDKTDQAPPIVQNNNNNNSNDNISVDNTSGSPASNTNVVVKNGNDKEAIVPSASEETDAKVDSSTPSVTSPKKISPVIVPTPNVKDFEPPKITYASILAKEVPMTSPKGTSPKAASIASNATKPKAAPSTAKASTPSSNVAPKLPIASNTATSTHGYVEGPGIYIGRLPYEITKHGIVEVLKRFGPVRRGPDSIQIRRHEDGFCCGFVEFESADAARRAVEVHHVRFGDEESYITYKKSSSSRGNDGRGRSPTSGGFRTVNSRGRENGERKGR
ncbi:hypothetical protein ACJIZ3_020016 [Penstemon smallii]|uniref:Nuclear transport factor 2 n=1 Tax=Penstemon smallii TaxID=265156 RepID=A0ABD3SI60_9LAMI